MLTAKKCAECVKNPGHLDNELAWLDHPSAAINAIVKTNPVIEKDFLCSSFMGSKKINNIKEMTPVLIHDFPTSKLVNTDCIVMPIPRSLYK